MILSDVCSLFIILGWLTAPDCVSLNIHFNWLPISSRLPVDLLFLVKITGIIGSLQSKNYCVICRTSKATGLVPLKAIDYLFDSFNCLFLIIYSWRTTTLFPGCTRSVAIGTMSGVMKLMSFLYEAKLAEKSTCKGPTPPFACCKTLKM